VTTNGPPEVTAMAQEAVLKGTGPYQADTGTIYPFNSNGIDKVSNLQLMGVVALGLSCSGKVGQRFIEMTALEYAGDVPVSFPNSTDTIVDELGENPVTHPKSWEEYTPAVKTSNDGSNIIIRCVCCDPNGDGLLIDDFMLWYAEFGARILTLAEYNALIATEAYQVVE